MTDDRKPPSKGLLDRFINAVVKEFKPERDALGITAADSVAIDEMVLR